MSPPSSGDFERDLLTAKDRDLKPLLGESADALDLDYGQTDEMEALLDDAWFGGIRAGQAQMSARVAQRRHDVPVVGLEKIEASFKALMEESAATLNLTMGLTIRMWSFLGQAWIAGVKTCEAELMGFLIESRSDVAEEARRWLEKRCEEDGDDA